MMMSSSSDRYSARRWSFVLLLAPALPACSGDANSTEVAATTSSDLRTNTCGTRYVTLGGSDADNACRARRASCRTIQHAVDLSCEGDTVLIGPGEFAENVRVDKPLVLAGGGPRTVIRPAVSSPEPCSDSSLCGGAASSVILVGASHVTIHDLVIDGDNPALTSGVSRGGADVDARNGIITDDAGPFDALEVYDVTVQNVFLRGIYASSGGTFDFHGNRVANVIGDERSVGIFNFGGAGIMFDNDVVDTNDAISSNHSAGVAMLRNRIRRSRSGLHTDNAGDVSGSPADLIEGNQVAVCSAGGYGVWAFAPYVAPTLSRNAVRGCSVGLALFGQGAEVTPSLLANRVDGEGVDGSVGIFVTTDLVGFGSSNVAASVTGNVVTDVGTGIYLQQQPGFVNKTTLKCNRIERAGTNLVTEAATTPEPPGICPGTSRRP